ncbi:hypothetical protein BH24ACT15_BH24ACT15_37870 [soil metagenome]
MDTGVTIGWVARKVRGCRGSTVRRIRLLVVVALIAVLSLAAPAHADTPGPAVLLSSQAQLVSGGVGSQTDPHLSGSLLVFTEFTSTDSGIRYVDLASGAGGDIPNLGNSDQRPDVSGNLVVFSRVFIDSRRIMVFDVAAPELGARELAPQEGARREETSIGASTVAFTQFVEGSSTNTEVCIADAAAPSVAATCLTSDATMSNRSPAVSPDGSTVAFAKCQTDHTGCDIWVTQRDSSGTWGVLRQLTDSTGEDTQPDTDGQIVTYQSNAGGDFDVGLENFDGTSERQLVLTDAPGSIESDPNISGGAIVFQRKLPGSSDANLYMYRPATGVLNQLTDTSADEKLNAVSLSAAGELRVAWAQPDGLTGGHNDIHALAAQLGSGPSYETCLLYDPTKSHKLGSTVPLQARLCDANGANLSSPELILTTTGLVKLDNSAATAPADSPGNSNPDSAFRYDPDLAGYVFNLSTKGLSRGTWELRFTVAGDPGTVYRLPFDVR